MALAGLTLLTIPQAILRLYTPDLRVIETGVPLLFAAAAFQLFDGTQVAATGALEAAVVLGVFVWSLRAEGLGVARALAFDTLVISELFRAFAARSPTRLFGQVGVFTNVRLLAVVFLSVVFSSDCTRSRG